MNAVIPGTEEKPMEMYALGANGNTGVYKFNPSDWANPTKLSSTAIGATGYTGSNIGGGGTFLSTERVVGSKYYYGAYTFDVTAEGDGNGAWSGSYAKASFDQVYDMTYDEKNDIIYCWYKATTFIYTLGIYNLDTKTITRVGNAANTNIYTLAIDKDGQLWGLGQYGLLYSIDKETAVAKEVTNGNGCGISLQTGVPASAAIDPVTNLMYVMAKSGSDMFSTLFTVDLTTYESKKISPLGYSKYYNCLWIAGSSVNENAPAAVENLSAVFNGEATVVTFTAPALTIGGSTLTGELAYTVKVDGEEAATGTVVAGETKSVTINPADGQHDIQVTVSNAEGESKVAKTTVFSGYDQPTAVGDLKAAVEGNDIKLTWTAPTGKNGGMVNMAKVRYAVSIDGETKATDLTATEYTCPLEGNYTQHTYKVIVVYDGTDAESSETSMMAGLPYDVPYTLDLANIASLDAAGITVIDLDGANSGRWTLEKVGDAQVLQSYSGAVWTRKDYVYLPPLNLKAGVSYTLKFTAAAYRTAYAESTANIQVLLANEPTAESAIYTTLEKYEVVSTKDEYVWNEYTVAFTVDKDGSYNLGIADIADAIYQAYYYLYVKDVAVTVDYHTPKAVSDLKAELAADNNRNVDLSFVLPTEDTEGRDLTSLTKVEIYRGEDLIKTLEGTFTPGETMTYTDENAPRGTVEYTVKVYSDAEVSEAATVSVAVGYAINLVIETVSSPEGAVEPNGEGKIVVKVANDGYNAVEDGDYEVVLFCNGEQVDKLAGTALATDKDAEYTFALNWTGETPAKATYQVKVVSEADENAADNATNDITVEFETGAPLAVSDLTATTQEDNNRNVDLTFTLPTEDVAGAKLTSISKIEIFRGLDLINTEEGNFAPGQTITYTDENAPRGLKNYKVVVYNGDKASAAESVSVRIGYLNNLQIETVSAPTEPIVPDGMGTITVKVTNDGFERVLFRAYEVVLYCGDQIVATKDGVSLDIEESTEYTFYLYWTPKSPASAEYVVKVIFDGDENEADNVTEPITVEFLSASGVSEIGASDVVVTADASSIIVKNAEGCTVTIYAADGRLIVSETAGDEYVSPALTTGVYIVNVNGITKKIALRAI